MLSQDDIKRKRDLSIRHMELEGLEPIDFGELENVVKKWMIVDDPGIIKLIPAIIIANRLPMKPLWIFLIGPSGGGKTQFIDAVTDFDIIYTLSLVTPSTFLSGNPGKADPSLLPKIDKKILVFKDWTNILSMNRDAKTEIMGQLRDIYDGHVKKAFGTGRVAEWGPGGKIGIIAAVTPIVDLQQQMNASLGERFIHYHIEMPDRKAVATQVLKNNRNYDEMEIELKNAYYSFYKGIEIPEELPVLPDEVQNELISLSNFCTLARSGVIRDLGFKKEVLFVPAAEMPTRITQQLNTLGIAISIINKGILGNDMNILYKIALDSIPQTNRMVMRVMSNADEQTTSDIAVSLGYPTGPIKMYLENLALLGVCQRVKAGESGRGGVGDRWTLLPEFVGILRKYEKIEELDQEEIKRIKRESDEDHSRNESEQVADEMFDDF